MLVSTEASRVRSTLRRHADVHRRSVTSPFCRWIEELARRGVVSGCGGSNYRPTAAATREQMAVFVRARSIPRSTPACVPPNVYDDVPETSPFCRWIEELTLRGVVAGCGGGNYCPAVEVTREQMSVFLAATFGLVRGRSARKFAGGVGGLGRS